MLYGRSAPPLHNIAEGLTVTRVPATGSTETGCQSTREQGTSATAQHMHPVACAVCPAGPPVEHVRAYQEVVFIHPHPLACAVKQHIDATGALLRHQQRRIHARTAKAHYVAVRQRRVDSDLLRQSALRDVVTHTLAC